MHRIGLYGYIMQKIKVFPDLGGWDFAVFSLYMIREPSIRGHLSQVSLPQFCHRGSTSDIQVEPLVMGFTLQRMQGKLTSILGYIEPSLS